MARLLRRARCRAAVVEGPHGELCAGLTDRLRSDDAHRLTHLDQSAGGKHAAVALSAGSAARLAGEKRADLHALIAGVLDLRRHFLSDLLVGFADYRAFQGVRNLLRGHAPDQPVAQLLENLAALGDRGDVDAVIGPAVLFGDDHVLCDIHQTTREIAGVGGLEGGVGETLAGAVRRHEVLEDR